MTGTPVVYETTHRIAVSELDPVQHLNTGSYAGAYLAAMMPDS